MSENDEHVLEGLPEHIKALASEKAAKSNESGWMLTLDFPCYYAVMSNAKNRQLREIFYKAYNTISFFIKCRNEKNYKQNNVKFVKYFNFR